MNFLLKTALFNHIVFGVTAIAAMYALWMAMLRREPKLKTLKIFSLGGLIALLLSWGAGGHYYLSYYGSSVKGVIKSGAYPWAHSILMEAKEHLFLFLPFLLAAAVAVIFAYGPRLAVNDKLKRALTYLVALMTVLGLAITFAGMGISGAVR